jgi:hypothetical protein
MNNIFHFKVQCFKGLKTGSNEKLWHTVLDTKAELASDERFKSTPGLKHFALDAHCLTRTDTWRIADMEPVDSDAHYVSVFDIQVESREDVSSSKELAPLLQPLHSTRMAVTSTSHPIEVTTTFSSARSKSQCHSLAEHTLVPPNCEALSDGNVNTPQIFKKSSQPGIPMYEYIISSAATYDAVYLYYNPSLDAALHKRLRTFHVECLNQDGQWATLLQMHNARNKNGWQKFGFSTSCTSTTFRLTNFNNNVEGQVYLFEVKFVGGAAATAVLPVCDSASTHYKPTDHCLPPVLAPRIQGWCVAHDEVATDSSWHTGGRSRAEPPKYNTATIPNTIASSTGETTIPCGSDFAMELTPTRYEAQQLTHAGRVAGPTKLTLWDADANQLFDKAMTVGSHNVVLNDQPMAVMPVDLSKYRQTASTSLKAAHNGYYYGHAYKWKFSGQMKITFWWRPVDRASECLVPTDIAQTLTWYGPSSSPSTSTVIDFGDGGKFCADQGKVLATIHQYCVNGAVHGGTRNVHDMWAPYSGDGDNAWVQVGRRTGGHGTCKLHHGTAGNSGGRPWWGQDKRLKQKHPAVGSWILCAGGASTGGRRLLTTPQSGEHTQEAPRGNEVVQRVFPSACIHRSASRQDAWGNCKLSMEPAWTAPWSCIHYSQSRPAAWDAC